MEKQLQIAPEQGIRWAVDSERKLEGAGFEVRRCLPIGRAEAVGPFIFFDHFGPNDLRPGEAKGAPSHPHAGIETLSYLLEGRAVHKDSLGNTSEMGPGEVQWMRAGRGVVHDERPANDIQLAGGRMHGLQLWLNMPAGHKHDEPDYRHFRNSDIPIAGVAGQGLSRVIAGEFMGRTGPVRTHSNPVLVHATMTRGDVLQVPPALAQEIGCYVISGRVSLSNQSFAEGTLVSLGTGHPSEIAADSGTVDLILFGGDRIEEELVRHGPFVMNTVSQIQTAIQNYQAGRMGWV